MLFNPHVVDPTGMKPNAFARLFPKASSIVPGKLFGMDCLQTMTNCVYGGVPTAQFTSPAYGPNTFAHFPGQGFDVLFTDGSVQFVQSAPAFNIIVAAPNDLWNQPEYAEFYGWLENGD